MLNGHFSGTCSLLAGEFPMRFFNRLGASEVDPDTICNKAGHVALEYLYGTSTEGFDPKTVRDSECILVWGASPSASAPHADRHWLGEGRARVIVVDPLRHPSARRDGLHAPEFLRDQCLGWDELEERIEPCTPEWGERRSGVPGARIEQAARLYARGPSLLWLGQGLQRQPAGGNVVRACALLPAVTGNLCRPGTLDPWPEPRVQLAGGRFATPSGRVELASRRAERDGYLRLPEPSADPPPGGGRLRPARGNLNRLNPGTKSDLGESSSVHGIEVAITPAAHRAGLGKCAGKMLAR